jgi:hypothetical protein
LILLILDTPLLGILTSFELSMKIAFENLVYEADELPRNDVNIVCQKDFENRCKQGTAKIHG